MASDPVVEGNTSQEDDKIKSTSDAGDENGLNGKEPAPALLAIDEAAAIPKGTIDPVYEAKARVLNHAVSLISFPSSPAVYLLHYSPIS